MKNNIYLIVDAQDIIVRGNSLEKDFSRTKIPPYLWKVIIKITLFDMASNYDGFEVLTGHPFDLTSTPVKYKEDGTVVLYGISMVSDAYFSIPLNIVGDANVLAFEETLTQNNYLDKYYKILNKKLGLGITKVRKK